MISTKFKAIILFALFSCSLLNAQVTDKTINKVSPDPNQLLQRQSKQNKFIEKRAMG